MAGPSPTTCATATVETSQFGEVLFSPAIEPDLARELIHSAALASTECFTEPGIRTAAELPSEQAAIQEAHEYLSLRRAELGILAPLPPISHLLSELNSSTGFAGSAVPQRRICRRFPKADASEHPLLTRSLWVHEIAHASGALHVSVQAGSADSDPPLVFTRCGCTVLDAKTNTWRFSAFEELAASAFEQDYARSQGAELNAFAYIFPIAKSPLYSPPRDFDDGGLGRQLLALQSPANGALHSLRLGIEHSQFSIFTVYGELTHIANDMAESLYPKLPRHEAIEAFRADLQRIQIGEPHNIVTDRIKAFFGPRGVEFFASLGSEDYTELFSGSYQMQLLACLNFSRELPAQEGRSMQDRIFDLNERYLSWQREQRQEPALRRQAVRQHIDKAVGHLTHLALKDSIEALSRHGITHEDLTDEDTHTILRAIQKFQYRLPINAAKHFIYHRILSGQECRMFEAKWEQAVELTIEKLGEGEIEAADRLIRNYALSPSIERELNVDLQLACKRLLKSELATQCMVALAEFCQEHHICLVSEIDSRERERLQRLLSTRLQSVNKPSESQLVAIVGMLGLHPAVESFAEHGYSWAGIIEGVAARHPETLELWRRRHGIDLNSVNIRVALAEGIGREAEECCSLLGLPQGLVDTSRYRSVPRPTFRALESTLQLRLALLARGKEASGVVGFHLDEAASKYEKSSLPELAQQIRLFR